MRILRQAVAGASVPVDRLAEALFLAEIAPAPLGFWLDAGMDAASGMSYLGAGSAQLSITLANALSMLPAVDPGVGGGVPLGIVGWLRYSGGAPVGDLLRVDRLVAIDHGAGTVELLALGDAWDGELAEWRDRMLAVLGSLEVAGPPPPPAAARARWRDSDARYLEKIAACRRAIHEGDAYQLCLTTEVRVPASDDPIAVYRRLRRTSPSHHGGYLRIGTTTLLSASPEQFLSVTAEGTVTTRPIKGTRPRSSDPADDARLARELAADEKERAENLMIVDLMRNDLSRVCAPGSVAVTELLAVESYAQVHQLVSTVSGELATGRTALDAVTACFPAGSMTGAPKLRAMELLADLEQRDRGVYSGAFGWFGADGSVELAMVIRSIVVEPGDDGHRAAVIGTGGGITSSSMPAAELAEVKLKAAALLAVLGAS